MLTAIEKSLSVNSAIDYAEKCLREIPHATKAQAVFLFRDRFTHSLRVVKWCERLLTEIPANRDAVIFAAVLHDIGYAKSPADHAMHGADMARDFLSGMRCPSSFTESVCDLIARHSDKSITTRMSNELMVLQDADCLDEIGALTVLWDCMAEGACDIQNYQKAYQRIEASYQNINGKNRKMKTELADRFYRQRLRVLRNFIDELSYELFVDGQ